MRGLGGAGNASLLGMLICIVPEVAGAWFAFRPGERLLSIIRPLTLGAVFAALCNFVLAIANGFVAISNWRGVQRIRLSVFSAPGRLWRRNRRGSRCFDPYRRAFRDHAHFNLSPGSAFSP